jgi:hypothetical protein
MYLPWSVNQIPRRLEREHGSELVRVAYAALAA